MSTYRDAFENGADAVSITDAADFAALDRLTQVKWLEPGTTGRAFVQFSRDPKEYDPPLLNFPREVFRLLRDQIPLNAPCLVEWALSESGVLTCSVRSG